MKWAERRRENAIDAQAVAAEGTIHDEDNTPLVRRNGEPMSIIEGCW